VLKGTLWLLLKNSKNRNGDKGEQSGLKEALKLNQPLATAYYLKEDLRQFWKQESNAAAKKFLCNWINKAESSKIAMLIKIAKTLRGHMFSLLNY
jgi:transposase